MPTHVVKTTTGFGTNLKNSLSGVLVGILLFLASFVVLWYNEGRLDMSTVAKKAEVLAPGQVNPAMNGKWVSLSAPVTLNGKIEDPIYLNPEPVLSIKRKAEMYAWVETSETKEEKKTGGSTETTTVYKCDPAWVPVEDVKFAKDFKCDDSSATIIDNPVPGVKSDTFYASQAMIGGYTFDPKKTELPSGGTLQLRPELLKPGYLLRDGFIYISTMGMASPTAAPGAAPVGASTTTNIGDVRISFDVVTPPANATIFGTASNGAIIEYAAEDGSNFLRLFASDRESAIKLLSAEYTMLTWILRLLGFLMMWIGMQMFFGPLNTLLDVLPFLGSAGRFLVGAVMFPIALVLSLVTILISIIFHNIFMLIAVIVLLVGLVIWRSRSKKAVA